MREVKQNSDQEKKGLSFSQWELHAMLRGIEMKLLALAAMKDIDDFENMSTDERLGIHGLLYDIHENIVEIRKGIPVDDDIHIFNM